MFGLTASALTGVIDPLLGKLPSLLEQGYSRLKGNEQQITSMRDELRSMSTTLEMMSESEEANPQQNEWMSQLRELAYDMEDCIETFTLHPDLVGTCEGIIKKIISLKAQYDIGNQISELKDRSREVNDRRKRFKVDPSASSPNSVVIDPRLPALFEEQDRIVGLESEMEKLVKWIMDGDSLHPERRVISIVGFGGLGKTTIANQVFRKVERHFQYTAFISVSRNPNVSKILAYTLLKFQDSCSLSVDQHEGAARILEDSHVRTLQYTQLVNTSRDYLENKRYLVVIDDIWSKKAWNEIQCAFPNNNHGSRVLTTTRIGDVARSCSFPNMELVYPMKALDSETSKSLFFKRIFGHEADCPLELKEIAGDILKKCRGLPLAVVNIASLLATRPASKQEWEGVTNRIWSALRQDHELEVVKRILFQSYYDLPPYLKICLLDLSTFPEDHEIEQSRLTRRWVAEGFVPEQRGQSLLDTAENYFNELINRNMIEPVNIDYNGRPAACRVHDIILDFIILVAVKENFDTVTDYHHLTPLTNKMRRLSLQGNLEEQTLWQGSKILSHVRSFTAFGAIHKMPPLVNFEVLRVLDLQDCSSLEDGYIRNIGSLRHLKYISLSGGSITNIPKEIGRLQHLQTLDLRGTGIKELPATIAQLHHLVHLLVPDCAKLPNGIGNMGALEEVSVLDARTNSPEVMQELRDLTKLKDIMINWCADDAMSSEGRFKESLVSSLCKLGERNLQTIYIQSMQYCSLDFLIDSWRPPPQHLRSFIVIGLAHFFSRLPKWILSLSELTCLEVWVERLRVEDVQLLAGLPALLHLGLDTTESMQETLTISQGFQRLKVFNFCHMIFSGGLGLIFEAGAAPRMEQLGFSFAAKDMISAHGVGFNSGISHLSSLKRLVVSINCQGASAWEVEAAEAAIRSAAALIPNNLIPEINRRGEAEMVHEDGQKEDAGGSVEYVSGRPKDHAPHGM